MAEMLKDSVDAIVTDPPYGLNFMNKEFDKLGESKPMQAWHERWAREVLRVLKPGGHLIAAGGTRTFHRLVCALEDAGFEIRDTVSHVYGSGFPKSKSMKDIGRPELGTALKPAFEPWTLARKPIAEGSVAKNILKHGTGAINVDASRVNGIPESPGTTPPTHNGNGVTHGTMTRTKYEQPSERWPANILLSHSEQCVRTGTKRVRGSQLDHLCSSESNSGIYQPMEKVHKNGHTDPDGTEEVEAWECVDECPVRLLDEQSGSRPGSHDQRFDTKSDNAVYGKLGPQLGGYSGHKDKGGASRFFKTFEPDPSPGFFYCAKASRRERTTDGTVENSHPTVKPLALMRYLVKMVTPPGGTVIDPFAGSGSTLVAAIQEGFDCVGIEREEEYAQIARARVDHAREQTEDKLFA